MNMLKNTKNAFLMCTQSSKFIKPSTLHQFLKVKTSKAKSKMQLINLMLLLFFILAPTTISQTLLQVTQNDGLNEPKPPNLMYCESWRLAVETNNAGDWHKIPHRCTDLVKEYVNGQQYITDSKVVARHAQAYAKTIVVAKDGKDVWIFDVDETLISNIQHYAIDGYRY